MNIFTLSYDNKKIKLGINREFINNPKLHKLDDKNLDILKKIIDLLGKEFSDPSFILLKECISDIEINNIENKERINIRKARKKLTKILEKQFDSMENFIKLAEENPLPLALVELGYRLPPSPTEITLLNKYSIENESNIIEKAS